MASKAKKSILKSVSTAKEHGESPLLYRKRAQPSQNDITALAYHLWQARGRPEGSPEEDWFHAERELASQGRNGDGATKVKVR